MENHYAGETFGCVFGGSGEIRVVDLGDDVGGVVADVFGSAVVIAVSGVRLVSCLSF